MIPATPLLPGKTVQRLARSMERRFFLASVISSRAILNRAPPFTGQIVWSQLASGARGAPYREVICICETLFISFSCLGVRLNE
jgi:hypothetical protein